MLVSSIQSSAAKAAARALPLAVAALSLAPLSAAALVQEEGAEAPATEVSSKSLGETFTDAGPIGLLIVVLSVIALALIIENLVSLKRDKLAPPELVDEIRALFDDQQYQEAMELCENEDTYFTRVCAAGIAKIGHPFETMEKSLEEMGDEESIKLHQKIGWLALIANVAPMMGLLGTVAGMISAFNTIASSGGQASPAELAGGISQALLTTMFGLIVAIPTTGAFAFVRNKMVKAVIEIGAIIEDIFERFRPSHV